MLLPISLFNIGEKNLRYVKFVFLIIIVSTMAACSSKEHSTPVVVDGIKTSSTVNFEDSSTLKTTILKHYDEWRNTPYRMGGLGKSGIDCSGFTYITFRSKLGCTLPRTTKLQSKTGTKVTRKNLRIGDLVFFKTSLFYRHVGIYLGDSKFLHASTRKGVIISSLKENYWRKCYWTARRVCS
ncbi:MAG TPA: cell wall hydrolase [Desulfocapsa sulfexigens]|nr:cell wall hydrolase [Desulfocapsa sulfexigens]